MGKVSFYFKLNYNLLYIGNSKQFMHVKILFLVHLRKGLLGFTLEIWVVHHFLLTKSVLLIKKKSKTQCEELRGFRFILISIHVVQLVLNAAQISLFLNSKVNNGCRVFSEQWNRCRSEPRTNPRYVFLVVLHPWHKRNFPKYDKDNIN